MDRYMMFLGIARQAVERHVWKITTGRSPVEAAIAREERSNLEGFVEERRADVAANAVSTPSMDRLRKEGSP